MPTGGGFQLPDFEDFGGFKTGGGGSSYTPGGGTGGIPPGAGFGPGGGGGSSFSGIGPSYDRGVPQFGYRRRPSGPVGNSRVSGTVSSPYGYRPAGAPSTDTGATGYFGPQATTQGPQQGYFNYNGGGPTQGNSPFDIQTGGYLGAASDAGAFDPLGSQGILNAIGAQYGNQMGARQRGVRSGLMAAGVDDPNAYAYGQLQGDLGAASDVSQAMQNAQLQSMLQNQGWLQNMAQQRQNWLYGNYQQGMQERFSHNHNPSAWSQIAGALGAAGGAALGSMAGPAGAARGKQVGGAIGGAVDGGSGAPWYMEDPRYGWGGTGGGY